MPQQRISKLERERVARDLLDDRTLSFCRGYLRSMDLLEAYRGAGFGGADDEADRSAALALLKDAQSQDYLARVADVDEASVLATLAAIVATPVTEIMRWDGRDLTVQQSDMWSDRAKLSVKRMKSKIVLNRDGEFIGTELDLEFYDRLSAADKLMRKMHLYDRPEKPKVDQATHQLDLFDDHAESLAVSYFRDITGTDFKPVDR